MTRFSEKFHLALTGLSWKFLVLTRLLKSFGFDYPKSFVCFDSVIRKVSSSFDSVIRKVSSVLTRLSEKCRLVLNRLSEKDPLVFTRLSEKICRFDWVIRKVSSVLTRLSEKFSSSFPKSFVCFDSVISKCFV